MKQIDSKLLDELTAKAAASPRKGAHYNLHPVLEDPVQRLCVAIEPGTYIRPHRHAEPATWEVFILLRGSAVLLVFDDAGKVQERVALKAGGPVQVVEITLGRLMAILFNPCLLFTTPETVSSLFSSRTIASMIRTKPAAMA